MALPANRVPPSHHAPRPTTSDRSLATTTPPGMSLIGLKSERARLDVNLMYLSRRHDELEKQLQQATGPSLALLRESMTSLVTDMERARRRIEELDVEVCRFEAAGSGGIEAVEKHDERLATELDQLRLEILSKLTALAEPIRRHQRLAEQKARMAQELSILTGRDRSYTNYLDCALLRKAEYLGDAKYVIEFLKGVRAVT